MSSSSGEPVISSATEFSGSTTEDLSVTLSITGTDPTVQVYREGVLLVNGPRIEFSFANTQFEMIISDLKQSDAGEYIIKASNDFAEVETTITVIPIGKSFFRALHVMYICKLPQVGTRLCFQRNRQNMPLKGICLLSVCRAPIC